MDSAKLFVLPYLLVLTLALQGIGNEGNLALRKNATQQSTLCHTYNGKYYCNSAWRAVDDLIHSSDPVEGCTSTDNPTHTDAWWMVDLGRVYVITNITVYSRRGAYFRLRDFWIRVGNSSDITQHMACTYKSGWIGSGESETFTCDGTLSGRWVSIQRTNDLAEDWKTGNGFLQLCEVQINGYTAMTPTPGVITTQGRSTIELPAASHPTKILTYKTTQQNRVDKGVTTYTRQNTTSGPEIPQSKVTSVVLGILLLIVLAVNVIIKIRKTYTVSCIRKEAIGHKEGAPVFTGSVAMTRLGHGEDYDPVQPSGAQINSAEKYEQEDPVHHQSQGEEEIKYETLNSKQMTSQEPKTYESLGM